MSALLSSNSHECISLFSAFTIGQEHVCIPESGQSSPPWIYGPIDTIRKIERLIGSELFFGDSYLRCSLFHLLDSFRGKLTVVGYAYAMQEKALLSLVRRYRQILYWIDHIEKQNAVAQVQETCTTFVEEQIAEELVFLFHDKSFENLVKERKIILVKPSKGSSNERTNQLWQAYEKAHAFQVALEKHPSEAHLELLKKNAWEYLLTQHQTELTYVFQSSVEKKARSTM